MDKGIEVIGIDHGWSYMKTISHVFVTGVEEIATEPAFTKNLLEFGGSYLKSRPLQNRRSFLEQWKLREQAQMQAEEIVLREIVWQYH